MRHAVLTLPLCGALSIASGCGSSPQGSPGASGDIGAGHPAASEGAGPASRDDTRRLSAAELERELRLTPAGRVLETVLRAHGGWDAWRRVRGLGCRVDRVCHEESEAQDGEATVVSLRLSYRLELRARGGRWSADVDPPVPAYSSARTRGGDGVSGAIVPAVSRDDQGFYLMAPFRFVERGLELRGSYLGEEISNGTSFKKIRFARPASEPPFPCIAYFDATTFLLSRLLVTRRTGGHALIVLSEWRRAPGSELLFPRRRRWYLLDSRFGHPDFANPDCEEKVLDLQLTLGEE